MARARSWSWSAPGRVNLIGEHIDYNGGPVLPFAIDQRTTVTMRARRDRSVNVTSDGLGTSKLPPHPQPGEVAGWASYVAAALWVFADAVTAIPHGLDIEITSTIPVGAGLSSSAAIECAVLCCLDEIAGSRFSRHEIAALATRAEREFVGVPCGPMDQLAAMLGEPEHALLIDSRSLQVEPVPLRLDRAGLALVVTDTKVQHALADGGYADRQAACTEAAAALGASRLSDATRSRVETLADPTLRKRARHVATEIQRVHDVVGMLRSGRPGDIGPLLIASHRSLAEDFEVSCAELDTAVQAALSAGALGARMTGAGFGGCAIILCRSADVAPVAERVRQEFAAAGFSEPKTWRVSPAAGARSSRR